MLRIKMLTLVIDASGVYRAGHIYTLKEVRAYVLILLGKAEAERKAA